MGDLVGIAELLDRSRAVAAADDRDGAAVGECLRHGLGANGELVKLKHAHGSVPDDGARAADGIGKQLDGLGADVHAHQILGDVALDEDRLGVGGELGSALVVDRQEELHAVGLGLGKHLLGVIKTVRLEQGLANLEALGLLEGIGHAAADDDGVGLLEQVVDDVDLVGDLGTAEDSDEGTLGIVQSLAHDAQFLLDEQASVGGQIGGNTGGGGVGAVHGAESVGDIDLSHVGQGLGEVGIVLGLALVEAQILEQQDLAGLQRSGLGLGVGADGVLGKDNVHAEQLTEVGGNRSERQLRVGLFPGVLGALGLVGNTLLVQLLQIGIKGGVGLAQVGAGDDGGTLVEQVLDGRQRGDNALVARDGAGLLVLGNVEIAAEKNFLTLYVGIVNGLFAVVHLDYSSLII